MTCRSCGGDRFGDVVDLGSLPLVNNLLEREDQTAPSYPLHVVFCRDCSLAQLTHTPPPDAMFREYVYFSSQSQTMVKHAGELVRRHVRPGRRVLEIASNDGYLLRQAKAAGATVLGVDPARNVAAYAETQGVPTRCEYFNAQSAAAIRDAWGAADVLFANNVLAHVPDPNEIAAGIHRVLAKDGRAHVEVPYLGRMLELCAFDTIYHEHQCYFSVVALRALFNRHGLRVVGAELVDIHGGSLHLTLAHDGDQAACDAWCAEEDRAGVSSERSFKSFAHRIQRIGEGFHAMLAEHERMSAVVAGFGAAAKAVVFLNVMGIGQDRIPWVADVSPHKQGRFIPGTRQAIVAPEHLIASRPEACIVFAWNVADEIAERNRAYTEAGGRFLVAIPEVREVRAKAMSHAS